MTASVILSYDQWRSNPVGIEAPQYNAPMYLRNRLLATDQLDPELRGYKEITAVYPAADLDPNSQPLQIQWGAFDYVNVPPVMGPQLAFTPDGLNYKLDYISYGRFIDLRVYYADTTYDVKISALDMDFTTTGKR